VQTTRLSNKLHANTSTAAGSVLLIQQSCNMS